MSTGIARRAPQTELAVYLENNISEIVKTCASDLLPRQLVAQGLLLVNASDDLKRCTQESVLMSLVDCASLGLSLSKPLGEGCLIPYGKECQFQPMYRGLSKLARENGAIEYIRANVVHKLDEFRVVQEPVSAVYHTPSTSVGRGPMTHVYSVVQYMSGRKTYNVLFAEDVEAIRQMSKQKNGPAWTKRTEEMWKKCAIKVHCKELDMTPKLAKAIELDNREYAVDAPVIPANNSGYGRGQYANDEHVSEWNKIRNEFNNQVNQRWLDKWTGPDGTIHPAIKGDLLNFYQLDGHLKKWACETGRLDATSMDEGRRGLGLYTAIVWFRQNEDGQFVDRDAMKAEMNDYQKRCWKRACEAVKAKDATLPDQTPIADQREPGDDGDDPGIDEALDEIAEQQKDAK